MKLIVCESCEAEFRITHSLDENYYKEAYCPFCGEKLTEEMEHEIEEYDERRHNLRKQKVEDYNNGFVIY